MPASQNYQVQTLRADLSDAEWLGVFDFKQAYARQTNTSPPYSWQTLKRCYLDHLNAGRGLYLVRKGEAAVGTFLLYEKESPGTNGLFLQYDFVVSHLDEGLLYELFRCFLAKSSSAKYLVLTSVEERNDYLEGIFSLEVSEFRELFELEITRIDKTLLGDWASAGALEGSDQSIQVITEKELPPALLEDYYQMIGELIGSVEHKSRLFDKTALSPERIQWRHKTYQESGGVYLNLLALKNGALIGYTEVLIQPTEPQVAHQKMTGVRAEYRKRGLGKRLKALMIQRLMEEYPEVSHVKTAVHFENSASRRLNRRLGFSKVGVFKEYIIPREEISAFVKAE